MPKRCSYAKDFSLKFVVGSGVILFIAHYTSMSALNILFLYFTTRLTIRVFASLSYEKVHYT